MVELNLHELAALSGDRTYPYCSTGKIDKAAPIRIDNGTKGELFLAAEFVPAMRLKNIKFDSHGTELDRAVERADGDSIKSKKSVQQEVTVSKAQTEDGAQTPTSVVSANGTNGTKDSTPEADEGVELSVQELFAHRE